MCGIAGLLSPSGVSRDVIGAMTGALAHRGPDDSGAWIDAEASIGLGHRRLAIIDLSPAGHQPMESVSGRYVLIFNGEIYNHHELRAELEAGGASAWRGHSDTETLLTAIDAWGLRTALERSTGMFALALWDRYDRTLALARDRFGEKPLFYGWAAGTFTFASELGAIATLPGFNNGVNRTALSHLLSRTYIPAPLSIYQQIFKLPPGTILTVEPSMARAPRDEPITGSAQGEARLEYYWSYKEVVRHGLDNPIVDPREAVDAVEEAVLAAVARQAVADVPVGAFLSGGIDSSTVVALYHAASRGPIQTFSIGFEEAGFDEAVYARKVAQHFGTQHHEMYVGAADALAVIPRLPQIYGEPFADSSAIPTHLVSTFARQHVTVALSGDGGDELFGGYNRYLHAPRLWRLLSALPHPLRRLLAGAGAQLPGEAWTHLGSVAARRRLPPFFGAKVRKGLRTAADARSIEDVFAAMLDEWHGSSVPVLDSEGRPPLDLNIAGGADAVRMMYADAVTYLPDDILVKVDRAAMACSLETRVPFLDHHVAAVAARLPVEQKITGSTTKAVLRQVLYRHAPPALFERPKAGFALPIDVWLRGPLRDWAEDLLNPAQMKAEGFFEVAPIRQRWEQHVKGAAQDAPAIWAVLMFQAWLRQGGAVAG